MRYSLKGGQEIKELVPQQETNMRVFKVVSLAALCSVHDDSEGDTVVSFRDSLYLSRVKLKNKLFTKDKENLGTVVDVYYTTGYGYTIATIT